MNADRAIRTDVGAPSRFRPDRDDAGAVLALIRRCFAYMEGRIDPPSSMVRLTEAAIRDQARDGEVWTVRADAEVVACVFLTPKPDCLYLGKLAVDAGWRGHGLARRLVDVAAARAVARGLEWVELQTRIELVENHRAFGRMGFVRTGETAHEGYDRPTSITMRRNAGAAVEDSATS